jgi:geranylgeranylglycerol-phosphate geranylgeranyltransferase
MRSEAVRIFLFLVLVPYPLLVIYLTWRTETPSPYLIFALALYVAFFVYYGKFLANYESNGNLPLVRHQLIWPVVLSIAIGLYFGLSFSDFKESAWPLLPVALVVALYVISFQIRSRFFLLMTLCFVLVTTVVSVINQIGYLPLPNGLDLSSMLFGITASAYLAVFEAWRITSDLAEGQEAPTDYAAQANSLIAKRSEYATATLAALTASLGVLPFYFIFSGYGSPFLIGFGLHAFAAFSFWFYLGREPYLGRWSWDFPKIGFGVAFLIMLAAAPANIFNTQFTFRFLRGFTGWVGISILLVVVVILVQSTAREFDKLRTDGSQRLTIELFSKRVNFARVLSLICLIFCLIITGLLQSIDESSVRYFRAELAFQVYAIFIFLCLIIAAVEYFREKPAMNSVVRSLLGFFLLIRVFTSVMIALVVVLPLTYVGVEMPRAILSALPFFCAAAGGFALNDFYDVEKDIINKSYRAIPSGKLSKTWALAISIGLLATAVLSSLYAAPSRFEFLLYAVSIVGVAVYNIFVRHLTLSKTFLTSAVSSLPVLYVIVTLQYPAEYLLIPVATSLFLLGRELLMDVRDMAGDRHAGIKTTPLLIGPLWTSKIGFLLLMTSSALLLTFSIRVSSVRNLVLSYFICFSVVVMTVLWQYRSGKYQRPIVLSLWLPIFCGILMLLK